MNRGLAWIFLVACGVVSTHGFADATTDNIARTKILKVASDPIVPPIADCDPTGKCTGFEVDLLNVIAKEFGPEVKIEWVKVKWDQIPATVKQGKADIGMNAIFLPKAEAGQKYDDAHPAKEGNWGVYSNGYYRTGIAVAYHAGDKSVSFESVKKSGQPVSAINDEVAVKTMRDFGLTVKTYDADDEHLAVFEKKKVKYVAYDYPILKAFVDKSKGKFALVKGLLPNSEQDYAAILRIDSSDFLKAVNAGIEKWKKSPETKKQMKGYGLN